MDKETRIKQMREMRYIKRMTLQQIADEYGISRERVRQLIGNTGYVQYTCEDRLLAEFEKVNK